MSSSNRIVAIDIAKFLGIVCIVIGHIDSPISDTNIFGAFPLFAYQFHVPLFFFMSGMFYKEEESWIDWCVKKIKRLYIPFLLSNIVFLIIYSLSHSIVGQQIILLDILKHYIKVALGLAFFDVGGATWFLLVLFEASLIYKGFDCLCHRIHRPAILHLLIVVLVSLGLLNIPACIQRVLTAIVFFHFGRTAKPYYEKWLKQPSLKKILLTVISFIITLIISRENHPDIACNIYGNRMLFYLSALSGIVFALSLSDIISSTFVAKSFSFIGTQTMTILIWHLIAFKLVSILQIAFLSLPIDFIFNQSCIILSGAWPLIYLLFGLGVPLLLGKIPIKHYLPFLR